MKKLIIFALSLSACCGITEIPDPCSVTYSDAQPVQFWPANCDTFNEEEVDGVFGKCFCQPFECDDEMQVQLTDTDDNDYFLTISDEDGNELEQLVFTQTAIDGTPDIPGVTSAITLPALSSGVNIAGPDTDWTTGSNPNVTLIGFGSQQSDIWANSYSFITGYSYIFTPNIDFVGDANTFFSKIVFVLLDASNNILIENTFDCPTLSGTYTTPISFTAPSGAVKYGFRSQASSTLSLSKTFTVDINSITATQTTPLTPGTPATKWRYDLSFIWSALGICDQKVQLLIYFNSTPDVLVLKSDCIHIKESWKETVLINYYNQRNFAGLIDPASSPNIDFNLRVPAVFSQERFPKESEVMDLSNSRSIQLFSQLKSQKLLETGPMPFYMHKKLNLVLQHQFVTIKTKSWVFDSYDLQESNKRWPLRRALAWLTEKDFVVRNVL